MSRRRRLVPPIAPRPLTRHRRRLVLPVLLSALALLGVAGCGGSSEGSRPGTEATLVLDFQPNAVHAGLFLALERGYDQAEGVTLEVRTPSATADNVKQLTTGRARFAILDLHDLALARARGIRLVAVMAVVQEPLAAVLVRPGIATPKDLEGQRVGVTGAPSDDAVLASILRGAGADAAKVRKTTIGFDAVPALLSKKVAGATAFWNAEGVALAAERPGTKAFKVDDYGAPAYPELVLTVTQETLQDAPDEIQATVTALQRGYREALVDPDSAVEALLQRDEALKRESVARELDAVQPALQANDGTVGTFDLAMLARWATWEQRFGIVDAKPDVSAMFAPRFAVAGAKIAAQGSG